MAVTKYRLHPSLPRMSVEMEITEAFARDRPEVSSIDYSSYEGTVMDKGSYAQICTAHQLNKAIPILLDIKANTAPTPESLEDSSDSEMIKTHAIRNCTQT